MAVDQISIAKAILWEEAKGKLRAVAAVSGAHSSSEKRFPDWEEVSATIEKFITDFEGEGFNE